MNSGTKIFAVFLLLILYQIGAGLEAGSASNLAAAPSPRPVEITGKHQLIFKGEDYLSSRFGLSDFSDPSTIIFSFTGLPAGVKIESCKLNPVLSSYYTSQLKNNNVTLTRKDVSSQPPTADYFIEVNFEFDWGLILENEITVEATLTADGNSDNTTPFILNMISYSLVGDVYAEDGENSLNKADITALKDHILGRNSSEIKLNRADTDANGRINVADIYGIIYLMVERNLPFY